MTDTEQDVTPDRDAVKAFRGTRAAGGTGAQLGVQASQRKRPFRALRRRLIGSVIASAAAGATLVPTRLLRGFAGPLAGFAIDAMHGRAIRERLERAFGEELTEADRRRVSRGVGRSLAHTVCDALAVVRGGERWLEGRIDTTESDAWLAEHRASMAGGFIGITAHCGNWELTARWVAGEFPGVFEHVVGKRAPNPHLNDIIERYRLKITGCRVLYRDAPASTFPRILKKGGAIGFLPDQDVRDLPGLFVDFFSRPAYTPIGPARLAVAAGLPLAGAFMIRTAPGRYRVRMLTDAPLVADPSKPRNDEILRLTQAYSKGIEDAIRAHPEQWPWFHDRWRTTPEKLESRGRRSLEL